MAKVKPRRNGHKPGRCHTVGSSGYSHRIKKTLGINVKNTVNFIITTPTRNRLSQRHVNQYATVTATADEPHQ